MPFPQKSGRPPTRHNPKQDALHFNSWSQSEGSFQFHENPSSFPQAVACIVEPESILEPSLAVRSDALTLLCPVNRPEMWVQTGQSVRLLTEMLMVRVHHGELLFHSSPAELSVPSPDSHRIVFYLYNDWSGQAWLRFFTGDCRERARRASPIRDLRAEPNALWRIRSMAAASTAFSNDRKPAS